MLFHENKPELIFRKPRFLKAERLKTHLDAPSCCANYFSSWKCSCFVTHNVKHHLKITLNFVNWKSEHFDHHRGSKLQVRTISVEYWVAPWSENIKSNSLQSHFKTAIRAKFNDETVIVEEKMIGMAFWKPSALYPNRCMSFFGFMILITLWNELYMELFWTNL